MPASAAARDVGTGAGNTLEDAGDAVEDVGQGAGGAVGGSVAKVAVKTVAHEIGSAASDEMKELGSAAPRRGRPRSSVSGAVSVARRSTTPLRPREGRAGGRLEEIEGTGSDGRITVKDVREAVEA